MEHNWPRVPSPLENFKCRVRALTEELDARERKVDATTKRELDGFNHVKNFIAMQNKLQADFADVCELLGEKGYDAKLGEKYNGLIEKSMEKHNRHKARIHETRTKIDHYLESCMV